MTKAFFNVGDNIIARIPAFGNKEFKGVILLNDLRGQHPVLAKIDLNGADMCVQSDAEGSNSIFHDKSSKPKGLSVVSYLFADGTATMFRDANVARSDERPAIGVMKATKLRDGTYTDHEFVSLKSDEAEATPFADAVRGVVGDIPPELKGLLDLFNRRK